MDKEMIFKIKPNKPRRELSLPALTFHHADHWMKVLGFEVFSAWLMIYTWCDRQQYPEDNVSHHKDIKEVAAAFKCSVNTAQKIIKTLYEYGLLDIIQVKNNYGGLKNIYYWYEIPVYADSMYSELKKTRSWEDRNWHGQKLAELKKVKKEKEAILQSRIKNEYGSENYQVNQGPTEKPYQNLIRQPYQKLIHNNDLNNNVVVEEPKTEKISNSESSSSTVLNDGAAFDLAVTCGSQENSSQVQQIDQEEKSDMKPSWEKIREEVRAVAGADISVSFSKEIEKNYTPEKVSLVLRELRRQLAEGIKIRGIGAWLRYALENDIQPDQPAKKEIIQKREKNNNRTPRARPGGKQETGYPMTEEQRKRPHLPGITNPKGGEAEMIQVSDAIQIVIAVTLLLTLVVLIADRRK